jgi:hypothetical protein
MATENRASLNRHELLALRGLRFPGITLQALQKAGIYSLASVSIEHQRSMNRYVIRGQESGGAVAEVGAYCGFVGEDGNPISWLQRVDTLAVNGIHARVVAAILVRVQVVRVLRTYDLLITKHTLRPVDGKGKPALDNLIIFQGRQGTLELELWGKDDALRGRVCPEFLRKSGDALRLPSGFQDAVSRVVAGVTCLGCRHTHMLVPRDSSDSRNNQVEEQPTSV